MGVNQGLVAGEGRSGGGGGGGTRRQGRGGQIWRVVGGLGGGEGQIWWGGVGWGAAGQIWRGGGGGVVQIWRHFIDNLSPSCSGQGVNMAVSGA